VDDRPIPKFLGIHHVRVPVTDVDVSRNWYREVLGLVPVLDYEEEDGLAGVVLAHEPGMTVGLHRDAARARALRGFCILALEVGPQAALGDWVAHLDGLGLEHSGIRDGHLGLLVEVPDPDGILVQLHTTEHPSADEA
jgi:catechol 2,3-dioxygenase-like lactoylglutathione lyase family enzyme